MTVRYAFCSTILRRRIAVAAGASHVPEPLDAYRHHLDLHGNAEALDALSESYDELWVLGDLVNYGSEPAYVIRCIRQRATVIVRGNHDHAVGYDVDPRCSRPVRAMAEATRQLTSKTLSDDDKGFLRDLPLPCSLSATSGDLSSVTATPSDPLFAYCPPDSPAWVDEIAAVDADVILVGHSSCPSSRALVTAACWRRGTRLTS